MKAREVRFWGCLALGVALFLTGLARLVGPDRPVRGCGAGSAERCRETAAPAVSNRALPPLPGPSLDDHEMPFVPPSRDKATGPETGRAGRTGAGPIDIHVSQSAPSRIDLLRHLLQHDPEPDVRKLAADRLASLGSPPACRLLISHAAEGGEEALHCLLAIEQVTSSHAQETLIRAAYDSALPADVRSAAIVALSQHKSLRVHTLISNLANAEPNEGVRSVAAQTIADADSDSTNNLSDGGSPAEAEDETWFKPNVDKEAL